MRFAGLDGAAVGFAPAKFDTPGYQLAFDVTRVAEFESPPPPFNAFNSGNEPRRGLVLAAYSDQKRRNLVEYPIFLTFF